MQTHPWSDYAPADHPLTAVTAVTYPDNDNAAVAAVDVDSAAANASDAINTRFTLSPATYRLLKLWAGAFGTLLCVGFEAASKVMPQEQVGYLGVMGLMVVVFSVLQAAELLQSRRTLALWQAVLAAFGTTWFVAAIFACVDSGCQTWLGQLWLHHKGIIMRANDVLTYTGAAMMLLTFGCDARDILMRRRILSRCRA